MKRKIFIIGSNSFIAKNVLRFIDKNQFSVISVCRPKFDLSKKNSISKLKEYFQEGSVILFVAAKAPVKSYKDYYYNIKILNNFLSIIDIKSIHHFYYISSDAIYSDSKYKIQENSLKEPENLHGLMHLNREIIIEQFFKNKCSFLRPTLVYGPGDKHLGYGPNKFINDALKLNKIKLFGKGEELRDHIYINDLAKLIGFVINNLIKVDLNLVTGKVISFNAIAKKIKKIKKKKIKIEYLDRNQPMPHNGFRAFDNQRINKVNKSFKFTSIDKALLDYIKKN